MSSYEEIRDIKDVSKVIHPEVFEYMEASSNHTGEKLNETWKRNISKNLKLFKKHNPIVELNNICFNKAVIGVGAGPSFNINKSFLLDVFLKNLQYDIKHQPFSIITSNHQFKPLTEMGVHPHFVVLLDSTPNAYDQLCSVDKEAILIASLYADPRTLKEWDRMGRMIFFFLPDSAELKKFFEQKTGKNSRCVCTNSCGNVLNMIWMLSIKFMGSKVFMAVGADYGYTEKKEFYADGDTKADDRFQINDDVVWQGFEFVHNNIINRPVVNLKPMQTSRQLFLYKTWTEMHIALWQELGIHFFNCSESGTLGVLSRSLNVRKMAEKENWFLLDDLFRNYHTMRLEDAINMYLGARKCLSEKRTVVPGLVSPVSLAYPMLGQTGIVKTVGPGIYASRTMF